MGRRACLAAGAAVLVLVGLAAAPGTAAPAPALQYASVSTRGVLGNSYSQSPVISADGKYVAFNSWSDNLVPRDTNGQPDVFVRDLARGLTRRITVDTAGEQADGSFAFVADISKDGRYILFNSDAGNLVPGDTNEQGDAFVHDRRHGITTRVSVGADGGELPRGGGGYGISADGRYVAFTGLCDCAVPGDTNRRDDVHVRDLRTGAMRIVSVASDGTQGNDFSHVADISANGRYVAFVSHATNLVPGDTNGTSDVFRHDLRTGETIRVSVGPGGRQSTGARPGSPDFVVASMWPAISKDGRHVAFFSYGDGLVDGPHATSDVYVRDVTTGTTTLVTAGLDGAAANRSGPDLPDIVPSISDDGRHVGFVSWASNLVTGDTNDWNDGFVRDLRKRVTKRVTVGPEGQQGLLPSQEIDVDGNADTVAFSTQAENFLPGDSNGRPDILVTRVKR
jgi:Tol biopolymer transport system component